MQSVLIYPQCIVCAAISAKPVVNMNALNDGSIYFIACFFFLSFYMTTVIIFIISSVTYHLNQIQQCNCHEVMLNFKCTIAEICV